MSRKVCGVMAGWLAAASVVVAQTGAPTGTPPAVKGKTLSPYYATASTVDWSGGDAAEAPPELLPPVPSTPVTPAAPAPRTAPASPVRQTAATAPVQPANTLPPATPPGATTAPPLAPSGPATPAKPGVVPAAPAGGSCGAACAPTCNCNPCGPNGPCGPPGRAWVDAEFLMFWFKGMNVPPLVTESPAGTPRELAGVIGAPTTTVLFGGDKVDDELTTGLRVRAGYWLDECQTCGIEGSYFFAGPKGSNITYGCNTMVIARPFIDVNPGVPNPLNAAAATFGSPNSELVCFPGVVAGMVNVQTSTELYGFDANIIYNLRCCCDYRIDFLAGYRYLNLQDKVNVTENLTVTSNSNPAIPQGTTFVLGDRFRSTNEFNGGQIGFYGETRSGPWYLGGRSLFGIGNDHSEITINGGTTVTTPGGATTVNPGGLLTQPTNIGTYNNDKFAFAYEGETILGYQVTDNLRVFASYSVYYLSNVARAGDAIDIVVNSSQIPPGTLNGAARPAFVHNDTSFWAQGISFGMELRY
jgi:Putative beta barrel porin-7 (BBP7)